MSKNSLIKYVSGELERVGNSIAITNKLLAQKESLSILHKGKTATTPQIVCVPEGMLSILGKSFPINAFEFYKPVFEWIEKYFNLNNNPISCEFCLISLNSDSSGIIKSILNQIAKKSELTGVKFSIKWCYRNKDDISVLELGQHLQNIYKDHFNLMLLG